MKLFLAILTFALSGCIQHSTNSRVSVPINVSVSVVPAVEAGGPR